MDTEMPNTNAYLRDKQQLVGWILNLASTLALAVGAWFFSGLNAQIVKLTDSIGQLKTQVAVLARDGEQIEELRRELRAHAKELNHLNGVASTVELLKADVVTVEKVLDVHVSQVGHAVMVDRMANLSARVSQIEATRYTAADHKAWVQALEERLERLEQRQ